MPPHQHIMYVDEPWYMKAGKDMLNFDSTGWYPKSIGWPFILSVSFLLFGTSNWVAIYASIFLGSLTVFSLFFLAYIITKSQNVSLVSSLVFSLFAAHIRWSAAAESNIASLFFITLALFFCFLYYRKRTMPLLWLSVISLAFVSQIRPENWIFPLLFLFGLFLFDKKSIKFNHKFLLPWLVLLVLIAPDSLNVLDAKLSTNWVASDTEGKLQGKNFGLDNLYGNSINYGKYIFNDKFQPLLFTLLFIAGFFYLFKKEKNGALFLLSWFLLLWFVYFFSWFQTLGGNTDISAKTRFFMGFYPVTSMLAAYGILFISDSFANEKKRINIKSIIFIFMTVLLVILFIPYSFQASSLYSNSAQKLESIIPEKAEKDIPNNCLIIANLPAILESTTDLNILDLSLFLKNEEKQKEIIEKNQCILFFEDYTCLDLDIHEFDIGCKTMKSKFNLAPFKFYQEKSKKYTFYRIISEKDK
ncbi:glycosyltransferase family 39 protein [Candidatus Woesearchaeota archaeon]|nr:glycosyltransferase family 39 protein [Candidatus Woesearchaeota archaeon]